MPQTILIVDDEVRLLDLLASVVEALAIAR